MRLSSVVSYAAWGALAAAQPYSYSFEPSNATLYQLSDDSYLAFLLEAAMATVIAEGASTAEILRIASQIVPGSLEGFYQPFHWFAKQMHDLAESIDPDVDPVGAREAYFHAATYNRNSVITLLGNVSNPRLFDVWPPMQEEFAKAISLLKPAPGLPLNITAANSSIGAFEIPAYFFKASASNASLPTFIVGTGYDGPMQDLYHFSCSEILKRGVNCLIYEGPGQATPRRAGHPFITDWWSVVTPIVDYLHSRPDVDTDKIVLLGDSFGGLLAPLAASKEHRLSAMVLLDGLPNFRQALIEQLPDELIDLYNQSKASEFNHSVLEALASPDVPTSLKYLFEYTFWSLMIEDPYRAWTRLGDFSWGPATAAEIGGLPVFVAKGQDDSTTTNEPELAAQYLRTGRPNGENLTEYHVFTTTLAAGEHTSLGAEAHVYIRVFGWLSRVWGGYRFTTDHL